jgi:predicted nucleic-acid-binding Zn-ribbon protein
MRINPRDDHMRINPKTDVEEHQICPNCDEHSLYNQDDIVGLFGVKVENEIAVPDFGGGHWGLMVFQCIDCGYVAFFNEAIVNPEED